MKESAARRVVLQHDGPRNRLTRENIRGTQITAKNLKEAKMASILQELQAEIVNGISFWQKDVKNLTHPNQNCRVGDEIQFTVCARNSNQGVTVAHLNGTIEPAPAVSFPTAFFRESRMLPDEVAEICTIKAKVVADTNDVPFPPLGFDKIAMINAQGYGDLSELSFNKAGILIGYISRG